MYLGTLPRPSGITSSTEKTSSEMIGTNKVVSRACIYGESYILWRGKTVNS